jgi:nicotinamidase-related amidase
VVVDVQHGFVVPETAGVVPALKDFLRHAGQRYDLIVATRFVNQHGSLFERERDWHAMMSGDETELLSEVATVADIVIIKHGLAPDPVKLLPALRDRDIQVADLCGFDTDQCVLATALLLWDAGIVPRLLVQLCASSGGNDMHEAGLAMARRAIGDRNVV